MRAGTHTVVATPHRSRRWPTEPEEVAAGVARMRELYEREGVELELLPGAEVTVEEAERLDDATLRRLPARRRPVPADREPATSSPASSSSAPSRALMERGYRVMLAHPERCPAFIDRPRRLRELVDRGVLCSVTAGALAGHFGAASRWFALELMRDGLAHSVDSDAHDVDGRPPGLREGLRAAAKQLPALARLDGVAGRGDAGGDPVRRPAAAPALAAATVTAREAEAVTGPRAVARYSARTRHLPAPTRSLPAKRPLLLSLSATRALRRPLACRALMTTRPDRAPRTTPDTRMSPRVGTRRTCTRTTSRRSGASLVSRMPAAVGTSSGVATAGAGAAGAAAGEAPAATVGPTPSRSNTAPAAGPSVSELRLAPLKSWRPGPDATVRVGSPGSLTSTLPPREVAAPDAVLLVALPRAAPRSVS